ncbi:MAG: hypothetical protein JNL09_08860 [Anaerolineales bacterium]|nr:hypothetical protein [Anaerolineales bacterium]
MKIPRRIQQIMPSDGWAAEIVEEGEVRAVPLVGWALVQDGTDVIVVGLVPEDRRVSFADEQDGFDGYAYIPSMAADAMEELLAEDSEDEEGDDDEPSGRRARLN